MSPWMQLHTGDPGPRGLDNVATNDERQEFTMGPASLGGMYNEEPLEWKDVPAAEIYTHFSISDWHKGGNNLAEGTMYANSVNPGDTFTITPGGLTLRIVDLPPQEIVLDESFEGEE